MFDWVKLYQLWDYFDGKVREKSALQVLPDTKKEALIAAHKAKAFSFLILQRKKTGPKNGY